VEKEVIVSGKKFKGVKPRGGHASLRGYEIKLGEKTLVLIVGQKGYLACGYLNLEIADKFNDCCAIITGVNTVEEMLEKKVVSVSQKAKEVGINTGMTGKEALQFI